MNKESTINKQLLIFTDLDGTLLDHDTYSFAPAAAALNRIARLGIPLVINSSKTAAEITAIQNQLNICQPFISENGAAVYTPVSPALPATETEWRQQHFAEPRESVLATINILRREKNYAFIGFADCDPAGIADLTGLSLEQANLAGERAYSEPLTWQGSNEALKDFLQQLDERQLGAQQGGRFLTVMSKTANKAEAMAWLCEQYADGRPQLTIALGDSPNDELMLDNANIAVVIQSKRSMDINVTKPELVIRTDLAGPAGWQSAMDQVLADFDE